MANSLAVKVIEEAWNGGYAGATLGARPPRYTLYVEDNTVVFCKLKKDDEELTHICLNCLLLERDFISSLLHNDPEPHLKELVCLSLEQKVKYLIDNIKK